ncbi:MAG: trypsin-like peptidase domain-containing protein [Planctomycetes bacterium]|nr:trypsin-like peptidase domain-containing protein [Planctomycetota bacterium]
MGTTDTVSGSVVLLHGASLLGAVLCAGLGSAARAEDLKPEVETRVRHAAVLVFTAASKDSRGDEVLGSGSGYFINGNGLLITNNHVVDPTHLMVTDEQKHKFNYETGTLTYTIFTDPGTDNEKKYEAKKLYQNHAADHAILQALEENGGKLRTPQYLRLLPDARLQARLPVWAIGYPGGDSQRVSDDKHPKATITSGMVLEFPRTPGGLVRKVFTDVPARPGNSGGPMVDEAGFLVGTVTLMQPPEGREDTGGGNYSALAPAKLTAQFIQYAFTLGKIPEGTDVTPFMEALTREGEPLNLPGMQRRKDRDALFFSGGDRSYGNIATETITWNSALGKTDFPTTAIAYVLTNDDGSHLFLEGGNRITASKLTAGVQFKAEGADAAKEHKFDSVSAVAFRTDKHQWESPPGRVYVLDTDVCHLVLSEVRGSAKFEGKDGKVDIAFADILRIDRQDDGQQVLTLKDDQRKTGKFAEGAYEATIAATRTPIQFKLDGVSRANVEELQQVRGGVAGLGLAGVLATADREIKRAAEKLLSGNAGNARTAIDELLKSDEFKKMADVKKDQVRLLDGVCLLHEGKFEEAQKALRKIAKSPDENVAVFSQAYAAVLKRSTNGQFDGKPLSDPGVFAAAGRAWARDRIQHAREILRDAKSLEGKQRSEYTNALNDVRKLEDEMKQAAIFAGPDGDDELVRLWRLAIKASEREYRRLETENAKAEEAARGGSPGRGSPVVSKRDTDERAKQMREARDSFIAYFVRQYEWGFRIEDPDIQAIKERASERGTDDKP